jgi:hypothetical protein
MATVKGASLAPEDHGGAGQIPDGDYLITNVYAGSFTYGGQVPDGVPAIMVTYKGDDGAEYEQPYKAGDNQHLAASEDGDRFIHPEGGDAKIYKGGAASMWLGSLARCNFPITGDSVRQFKGTKVTLTNTAAPKGKTSDNKDKVIAMVSKILSLPKATSSASKTTASAAKPTGATTAAATTQATASNGNSDLTSTAIEMIQAILADAPDNTMTRVKLSTSVMLRATKDAAHKTNMTALKKLAGDPTFLIEHAEAGGWATETGEEVKLG